MFLKLELILLIISIYLNYISNGCFLIASHRSGIVKSLSLYLTITYSQLMSEQTGMWIS